MKLFIIIHFLMTFAVTGCANSGKTVSDEVPKVIKAEYKDWNDKPVSDSDVRETGTDLTIQVKNWPQNAEPKYIIYDGRKSFPASVTDSTEDVITITARIIIRSSVMSETSEKSSLSDRLLFVSKEESVNHIEINEWQRKDN